jgi:hypothetical protein
MERFVLTTKKHKKNGRVDLVLNMEQGHSDPGSPPVSLLLKSFSVVARLPHGRQAICADENKWKVVLRTAERLGMLFNAEKTNAKFPATFDGSARQFADVMFDNNYDIGELVMEHKSGMILAMAFMLAGRCSRLTKMNAVIDGLVNLENEVVLYFFTLMAYGNRQKAGRAALYALLTTKN